jgi:hypothetical protein
MNIFKICLDLKVQWSLGWSIKENFIEFSIYESGDIHWS